MDIYNKMGKVKEVPKLRYTHDNHIRSIDAKAAQLSESNELQVSRHTHEPKVQSQLLTHVSYPRHSHMITVFGRKQ